ncbi:MAG: hypothetical protein ACRD2I_02985 [Vicinamibacterales bacterium]
MRTRKVAAVFLAAALMNPLRAAAEEVTLLRVFLTDGTSLVSYGEPSNANNRVIFLMPTAATKNPPLHLVNLPLARVDWDRTTRYATNARASHYVETQAESDYAELSSEVASTLNEVARTVAPSERLAIVQRARQTLADWPQNHYNYRAAEVRQMLGLLDEAIADLEASRTPGRFALNLSTFTDPPVIVEPLLPPPATPQESIEQMLAAARAVDVSVERTSLLASAVGAIDREKAALPPEWARTTRALAQAEMVKELNLDRSYRSLTSRMMLLANRRAAEADVRGIERLVAAIHQWDTALGEKRPEAVNSLVQAVQVKLDAARRLQLARDHYALRAVEITRYRVAMRTPMEMLTRLTPSLEAVKALSGSAPEALDAIEYTVAHILTLASAVVPPQEFVAAHALLISAAQLAGTAAKIRREATLASDMSRAWDASSAAAGALMLGARARSDIQTALKPPQLR